MIMGNSNAKNTRDFPPLLPSSIPAMDYYSVNTPYVASPYMTSYNHEDLRIGTSLTGQISPVRRFFCLLTTFDLLFIVLLWLISAMINGIKQVKEEISNYSIQKSFFDIVLLSLWRFILLLSAYALFRISHWWIVAVTTAGSGAFIIAKVFVCDQLYLNHVISIVLLLCSFILSWGELWFLDFKVVPSEMNARTLLARYINECTPTIPDQRYHEPSEGGSTCFFSPAASEKETDSENEEQKEQETIINIYHKQDHSKRHLTTEETIYKRRAEEAVDQALNILTSGSWNTAKVIGEDIIQSQYLSKYGKIFKYVGIIDAPASKVMEEIIFKVDELPKWNPTVKYSKIVQKIDNNTDIVYVIAAEGAGGLVSSRDFVNVRMWQKRDSTFVCASLGTNHPDYPPEVRYIRGEQGPSCYVLSPVEGNPNKCHIQWLLNTNLKGWLPQYLIDQSIAGKMQDCIHHIRRYLTEIH